MSIAIGSASILSADFGSSTVSILSAYAENISLSVADAAGGLEVEA